MKINLKEANPSLISIFNSPNQIITLDANFLIPPDRSRITRRGFDFPLFKKVWLDPIFTAFPMLAIHEAVREALLNAIVHRDYSFSSSTLISIFDDHIEFISMGGLAKGISYEDMMLGISVARNENLANVFYRLTLIEAYGTGMPKILHSYENYHVKPRIEISNNAFKIILPNTNAILDTPLKDVSLSANEKAVIDIFNKQDLITRRDVENTLDISQAMAVRVLKGLVDKSMIKPVGAGKRTKYQLEK